MATFVSHNHWGQSGAELWGIVTAVQANYYWVNLDALAPTIDAGLDPTLILETDLRPDRPQQTALLCTRRARLKKIGQQVMVGDRVQVVDPDWEGGRGAIAAVASRNTVLDRPAIANATQILLMFALAEPDLEPAQLSRFLVKAESTGLEVVLCLNKQDLASPKTRDYWQHRLQQWGYSPLVISVQAQSDLNLLRDRLQDGITVVSGPSGVGKSSLINQLVPEATLRTGTVSGKLGRGRHTTRHVELFTLPQGGLLADTPGFNQPDLLCTPEDLGYYWPEIRQSLAQEACQFNNCLHRDEPGCAVGTDWDRHDFYLTMLEEVSVLQDATSQRRTSDIGLKVKMGELGQVHHEPMLQANKYRRVSRRRQKQTLDELRYDLPESVEDLEDLEDLNGEF